MPKVDWKRIGRTLKVGVVMLLGVSAGTIVATALIDPSNKWGPDGPIKQLTSLTVAGGVLWATFKEMLDVRKIVSDYWIGTAPRLESRKVVIPLAAACFTLVAGLGSARQLTTTPPPPIQSDALVVQLTTRGDPVQYISSPALLFDAAKLTDSMMPTVKDHSRVPATAFSEKSVSLTGKQLGMLDKLASHLASRCRVGADTLEPVTLEVFGFASDDPFRSRKDSKPLNHALANYRGQALERELRAALARHNEANASQIAVRWKPWPTLDAMTNKREEVFRKLQITYSERLDYRSAVIADARPGDCDLLAVE